ncbi:MAG: enoyl-CoA hydratase/isomerase family protein [Thermoanaerobaculia bacterium]|nr:enoyl-CoA hydratase/isomerase family protein [Thermoanaerobaculia bacterium]
MKELETLRVEEDGGVMSITLDRPSVHNAFNDELIAEAIELFEAIDERRDLRAVVLRSDGKNFCAGADLNWMSEMVDYSREENIRDSAQLAKMFALMNECSVPIVGRIQGAAIGGGVGLVAVCDVVIAEAGARFGLSEVKLGILPAVISPYVIRKIGESHARALFLTGERFDAQRALRIGLVHRIADGLDELDRLVEKTVGELRTSGPEAVRHCKSLVDYVSHHPIEDSITYTIDAIADRRVSEEGQEGMGSFLRKEKPSWVE